jgi:AcrR family transcriptional regulator
MVGARNDGAARGAILTAATRLFAARGFDATPLQAIADEVGVTKQAVLHHFPSKELLRKAVFDDILAHWNETLPRLLLASSASNERFDAVFAETLRFFTADASRARLVAREALDRPKEMRELLRGPVRPWIAAISGYIRAGQDAGRHYADVDPDVYVAEIMLFVITTVAVMPVVDAAVEGRGSRERMLSELTRIARASLFASGSPARAGAHDRGRSSTSSGKSGREGTPWRASSATTTTSGSGSKRASTGRRSSS